MPASSGLLVHYQMNGYSLHLDTCPSLMNAETRTSMFVAYKRCDNRTTESQAIHYQLYATFLHLVVIKEDIALGSRPGLLPAAAAVAVVIGLHQHLLLLLLVMMRLRRGLHQVLDAAGLEHDAWRPKEGSFHLFLGILSQLAEVFELQRSNNSVRARPCMQAPQRQRQKSKTPPGACSSCQAAWER